jgi:inner membrane protein
MDTFFALFRSNGFKMLVLSFLTLILMIPLAMVRDVLNERTNRRDEARQQVARGWGGEQWVSPPFLVFDYQRIEKVDKETRTVTWRTAQFADTVNSDTTLAIEDKHIGIFHAPIYTAQINYSGNFAATDIAQLRQTYGADTLTGVHVQMLVRDMIGIKSIDHVEIAGKTYQLAPTGMAFSELTTLGANIPLADLALMQNASFEVRLHVKGTGSIQQLPLARELHAKLDGPWANPSFVGGVLPVQSKIDAQAFSAQWNLFDFNRSFGQRIALNTDINSALFSVGFGVDLYEPADVYQVNLRTAKYGVLFVTMTLFGFFLAEVLLKVRLHVLHYGLIGCALALFYLLLLALSEHLSFARSYLVAGGATVMLICGYVAAVLSGWKRGLTAGGLIALIYGFLFVLVTRETYALLLGTIGLFFALAVIMYLTRSMRWSDSDKVATNNGVSSS